MRPIPQVQKQHKVDLNKKKVPPTGARLKSTTRRRPRVAARVFSSTQAPVVPRSKPPTAVWRRPHPNRRPETARPHFDFFFGFFCFCDLGFRSAAAGGGGVAAVRGAGTAPVAGGGGGGVSRGATARVMGAGAASATDSRPANRSATARFSVISHNATTPLAPPVASRNGESASNCAVNSCPTAIAFSATRVGPGLPPLCAEPERTSQTLTLLSTDAVTNSPGTWGLRRTSKQPRTRDRW